MIWTVDAIFDGGVLRPMEPLPLHDRQRVRVTIEPVGSSNGEGPTIYAPTADGRERLVKRLQAGGGYRFNCPLPSRDELHER